MAPFLIVGLLLLIVFLCFSQSIPEMTHQKPARSTAVRQKPIASSKG